MTLRSPGNHLYAYMQEYSEVLELEIVECFIQVAVHEIDRVLFRSQKLLMTLQNFVFTSYSYPHSLYSNVD
jgi:hypothetical protein